MKETPINSAFPANPHALIKDGIVTEVVFMQEYGPEEIAETLSKYDYDKVVRWDDYGFEISLDFCETYLDDYGYVYTEAKPFNSWVYHPELNDWVSPVPHPHDIQYQKTEFTNEEKEMLSTWHDWNEKTLQWERNESLKKVSF